eukprot:8707616-Alexandrium_andersonii.AAC.1
MRKNPNKIGAKQAFMGGLVQLAHKRRSVGIGSSSQATQTVVKHHGKQWEQLSDLQKQAWHERALGQRSEAKRKIEDALADARAQRQ